MAFLFVSSVKLLLLVHVFIFSFTALPASSLVFDVGGADGWALPPANDSQMYNHWASMNRFNPGDIVRFRYEKDSVMVVSEEEEYEKCKTTRPEFFSNNGDTLYKLNRPGDFYFISGVPGHCERGERMIIKVISHAPGTSPPSPDSPDSSNAVTASALQALAAMTMALLLCA